MKNLSFLNLIVSSFDVVARDTCAGILDRTPQSFVQTGITDEGLERKHVNVSIGNTSRTL